MGKAEYRPLYCEVYTNPRLRTLERGTPGIRDFYICLIGNPNTTESGVYKIDCEDLERFSFKPEKQVKEYLKVLEQSGYISWDEKTYTLFVHAAFKRNVKARGGNADKVAIGVLDEFTETQTSPHWKRFKDLYGLENMTAEELSVAIKKVRRGRDGIDVKLERAVANLEKKRRHNFPYKTKSGWNKALLKELADSNEPLAGNAKIILESFGGKK